MAPMNWLNEVKWDAQGLVPVIAQEQGTGDVLMFAWMNREALAKTAEPVSYTHLTLPTTPYV